MAKSGLKARIYDEQSEIFVRRLLGPSGRWGSSPPSFNQWTAGSFLSMTYTIAEWETRYENNRTRELKHMAWVPIPNSHDGDGYTALVDRENGAAYLGAWVAILQVASKCDPRGTLVRDGARPHDAASLSRITRLPREIIQATLDVCLNECKWLNVIGLHDAAEIPHLPAEIPHLAAKKGTERNGIELKRTEERGNAPAREDRQEFPSKSAQVPDLAQAKALVMTDGIPDDFLELAHADWMDNAGCNGRGIPKPWQAYVRGRWRYEQVEWRNGTHRGKKHPGGATAARVGPSWKEVMDYAAEKDDAEKSASVYAGAWWRTWEEKGWKTKDGKSIDWKVKLSADLANRGAR